MGQFSIAACVGTRGRLLILTGGYDTEAIECSQCHTPNPPGFRFCGGCGAPLAMPAIKNLAPRSPWSLERRTAVLQYAITAYLRRGFGVTSQTPTTAQLVKRRGVGEPAGAILWLYSLFGGLNILSHLAIGYIHSLKDQNLFLSVDEKGHLFTWVPAPEGAGSRAKRYLALAVTLVLIPVVGIGGALLLSWMMANYWGIR